MPDSISPQRPIRLMIVDDSAFLRLTLGKRLAQQPGLEVVGYARNGEEALDVIPKLTPDVVTLDVEMPGMDGITTLRHIMRRFPLPVVMLSNRTTEGAWETISALALGAVDFVAKPASAAAVDRVVDEIVAKVKIAARATVGSPPTRTLRTRIVSETHPGPEKSKLKPLGARGVVIVIGSSTGGPRALAEVIPQLPADLPAAMLIVQHMPAGFTRSLAERLDQLSAIQVKEAQPDDKLHEGQALVAPGGFHMTMTDQQRIALDQSPTVHGVRPAVDVTLRSVLQQFHTQVIPVILTGMGSDGALSALQAHERGCTVIAEDESTSVVWGMPRSVVEVGAADRVMPLPKIAHEIVSLARKNGGRETGKVKHRRNRPQ